MELSINRWEMSRDRFIDGLERMGITEIHIGLAKKAAERVINGRIDEFSRICMWLFENEPSLKRGAVWICAWDIIKTAVRHWKREEDEIQAEYFLEADPNQLIMFDRRPRWAIADRPKYIS